MLKKVLEKFSLSTESRNRLLNGCIESPEEFREGAQAILSGHFLVQQKNKSVRVYPTCIEFYYHEEFDGGVFDPIVYHRNKKGKDSIPAFNLGVLHNHVSGIDITFEKGNEPRIACRASALIREFRIEGRNKIETRSTYLYEALYSQFSIFDGGFNVSWQDGDTINIKVSGYRKNVAQFVMSNGKYVKKKYDDGKHKTSSGYIQDERKWQFKIKEGSTQ